MSTDLPRVPCKKIREEKTQNERLENELILSARNRIKLIIHKSA